VMTCQVTLYGAPMLNAASVGWSFHERVSACASKPTIIVQ